MPRKARAGAPTPDAPASPAATPPAATPAAATPPAVSIPDPYARFHGAAVVIDTRSNFVFLGTVTGSDLWFVELQDVDVHDRNEGHSTNEKYIMEARKYGVKVNRKAAVVVKEQIVGISRLDDIIEY